MLNLIDLWKHTSIATNPLAKNFFTHSTCEPINADVIQSSFEFNQPPKIVFIKNNSTDALANTYCDLPSILLTESEEKARLNTEKKEKEKDKNYYDGNHMIITAVIYNEESNTLYLEAKKVRYSFLLALNNRAFPEDSVLYDMNCFKISVLAPLISLDDQTIIMQRTRGGLYSVPGGFIEPIAPENQLNFDNDNLISITAGREIQEEIAGIKGSCELRFQYSIPKISAISFRKTNTTNIGNIEFVAPSYANCTGAYLQKVLLSNEAPDAYEHTGDSILCPLRSEDRRELLSLLLTGQNILPNASRYLPVALSTSRLLNSQSMMPLPRTIPNSYSRAWPLSFFSTNIPRPYLSNIEEHSQEAYGAQAGSVAKRN